MYIIELLSEMVYKVYKSSRSQPARLYTMSQVQKGVYTVNEKMTVLKTFYKLVKYMWEKLVTVCGERILAFA